MVYVNRLAEMQNQKLGHMPIRIMPEQFVISQEPKQTDPLSLQSLKSRRHRLQERYFPAKPEGSPRLGKYDGASKDHQSSSRNVEEGINRSMDVGSRKSLHEDNSPLKYNQHAKPDYQSVLKYNIITGVEEEDRLPMLPSPRHTTNPAESLLYKQKEVELIMRKMRQQRELINGAYVK